jgi:hypothetical protein
MKAEEYDAFLDDPSDFIVRRLWPRIFGALKGFEKLSPLHNIVGYSVGMLTAFSSPEVAAALDALREVSQRSMKAASYSRAFALESKQQGFPMVAGAATHASWRAPWTFSITVQLPKKLQERFYASFLHSSPESPHSLIISLRNPLEKSTKKGLEAF